MPSSSGPHFPNDELLTVKAELETTQAKLQEAEERAEKAERLAKVNDEDAVHWRESFEAICYERDAAEERRGLREAIERAAEKLDTAYWKMTEDEDVDSQIILVADELRKALARSGSLPDEEAGDG